jgi:hypothetical protein
MLLAATVVTVGAPAVVVKVRSFPRLVLALFNPTARK